VITYSIPPKLYINIISVGLVINGDSKPPQIIIVDANIPIYPADFVLELLFIASTNIFGINVIVPRLTPSIRDVPLNKHEIIVIVIYYRIFIFIYIYLENLVKN
jgi:hypothetical protein